MACSRIRLLGAGAVPGDLVLPDDNATDTDDCAGTTGTVVTAPPPPEDGKEDVGGAEISPSGSGVDAAGGTDNKPSGVGDGVVSCPVEPETAAASEPSRPGADRPRSKGAVSVLTREAMDRFASQGVTPGDLLRRVVLPLAGTSVQYPHHGVRFAMRLPFLL